MHRINLLRNIAVIVIALCLPQRIHAQSTLIYAEDLNFQNPADVSDPVDLDIDQDGLGDFALPGVYGACTLDIPASVCTTIWSIGSLDQNSLLCKGYEIAVQSEGTLIGPETLPGTEWKNSLYATVASYTWSGFGGSAWGGPLVTAGKGYIGVRLQAADGPHFGWIYARVSPTNSEVLSPTYVSWACESRPNTPVVAGSLPSALLASPQIVRPNQLRLTWHSEINRAYRVHYKDELDSTDWTSLDFTLIASSTTSTVDLPIQNSARFYRVVQVE